MHVYCMVYVCLAAKRECVLVQKFQINSLHTYTNGVSVRLGFRFSIDASFVVVLISVFGMLQTNAFSPAKLYGDNYFRFAGRKKLLRIESIRFLS